MYFTIKIILQEPNFHIRLVNDTQQIPFDLLLLADPSRSMIEAYLAGGNCYVAFQDNILLGVLVLCEISPSIVEIKNIAVRETAQGRGLGKRLLEFADQVSREAAFETIRIGTGNSSIGQLALYQKVGFEMVAIKKDFFLQQYEQPIFEHGIQCKHMIVLEKKLD